MKWVSSTKRQPHVRKINTSSCFKTYRSIIQHMQHHSLNVCLLLKQVIIYPVWSGSHSASTVNMIDQLLDSSYFLLRAVDQYSQTLCQYWGCGSPAVNSISSDNTNNWKLLCSGLTLEGPRDPARFRRPSYINSNKKTWLKHITLHIIMSKTHARKTHIQLYTVVHWNGNVTFWWNIFHCLQRKSRFRHLPVESMTQICKCILVKGTFFYLHFDSNFTKI